MTIEIVDSAVLDDSDQDNGQEPSVRYEVSSFGADYDVEGVVRRLRRDEILIPDFQREFVWNLKESSRFIESLLLGLPVPGIFLAKDPETNKLLVIDGQQRLLSLKYYYDGIFNPSENDKKQRLFRLANVQDPFNNKKYDQLEESDRLKLDNSIIHATIIKQEAPSDNDTSIFHIFERLNSGGKKLTPQEIRTAAYFGPLTSLIGNLNKNENWRSIFGKPHQRLKDEELILRFLAFSSDLDKYERPLHEFLNKFCLKHRNDKPIFIEECEKKFSDSIAFVFQALSDKAFKPQGVLNAAVFDSVLVAVAKHVYIPGQNDIAKFAGLYSQLIENPEYKDIVTSSTGDEARVIRRFQLAEQFLFT